MKRCFVVGSAVWVLVWTAAASAAELCVAPAASGSGDGSDWANAKAWTDTPERGDTWYVADGDYPGKTFDVAESGTTPITIRKATIAEHGPGAGWTDALGDGQASFSSSFVFESPHWVVDGVTGGGAGSWDEGFGFKIRSTDDGMAIVRIAYASPADDVTVRHVDLEGKGSVSDQGGGYSNDAVAIYGASKVTVSHAWIHGAGRCPFFIDTADSVFEHIWVQSYFGSNAVHSEVASIWSFAGLPIGDITFRYNLFTHIVSTGGLMFDNASNPSSHLYVYGNVFYKPPGDPWEQANGLIGGWTGGNGEQMHNVWVDDNTFVGIDQSTLSTLPNVASGSRAQNNLWVGSDAPSFSKFETHDYNHFVDSGDAQGEAHGTTAAGDPFVDLASLDFLLIANTEPGLDLGPPFDVDGLGHARKTWTRGAFELCEGTACDPSGTGGAGGAGTGGSGAGASGTGGGGAGGAGSGAASGSSSGSGADATDDGGCGCRAAPLNDDRSALGVGAAMALLAWARARRRSIRAGRVA